MTKKTKITALIAALILLLSLSPVNAIEPEPEEITQIQDIPVTSYGLPIEDIPEVISVDEAEESGYTKRLRDEEIYPNTIIFANDDGTNTMQIFSEDIWYKDENGQKRDYDTELTESTEKGMSYETNVNNRIVRIGEKASDGVFYSEKGFSVTFTPSEDKVVSAPTEYDNTVSFEKSEISGNEDILNNAETEEVPSDIEPDDNFLISEDNQIEKSGNIIESFIKGLFEEKAVLNDEKKTDIGTYKDTVSFNNVYKDTDYEIEPELHGVKNIITIKSKDAPSVISYRVSLNGLKPGKSQGDNIPLYNESGEKIMQLNYEGMYDASGSAPENCNLDIAEYNDGDYLISLYPSEGFIGEGTVYPLTAMVAATAVPEPINDNPIYDTYVSTANPNTNYGTSASLYVGKASSTNIYYTYVSYHLSSYLSFIKPNSITSAYVYFYRYNGGNSATVYPYISNASGWNAQTLTYNQANSLGSGGLPSRNGVNCPASSSVSSNGYKSFAAGEFIAANIREHLDPNLYRTLAETRGLYIATGNSSGDYQFFHSANASSDKPKAIVYYYPNYCGGAPSYSSIATTDRTRNCLGFAIDKNQNIQPSDIGYSSTTIPSASTLYSTLSIYLRENGKNPAMTTRIAPTPINKVKIAMRSSALGTSGDWSYHFWIETSNGEWAHKKSVAYDSALLTDRDNPDDDIADGWYFSTDSYGYIIRYTGDTVYFTITR